MNKEQFDALVGKLEGQAQKNPTAYKLRVYLLATLGNAYIAAILALLFGLLAALIASVMVLKALALKLIFIVAIFLWMILRALWVRIDPPTGLEIKKNEAPELFATIEELRSQLGAPRFHHVLVTADFNAGVVQSPRLGILGWPSNYLLIGLPLMKALTAEQFKAVLAHEFGHLAGGHGRMSNWVYRQRLRWSRLVSTLEASRSQGSFLFKPFLNWFAPYFNAYSFPMARANEYDADATSVRLTSSESAAEALTSVDVVGSYLAESYWPQIHQQADNLPRPSFAPYSGMGEGVATGLDEASTRVWMERAMARITSSADTHPSLADRLKAIGEVPRLAPPIAGQAADRLLGSAQATVSASFDSRWQDAVLASWEERYRQVQDGRRHLAELNARFENGEELTLQEAFDRAKLTETIARDSDGAIGQLRSLHERIPHDAGVCFILGAQLLARDDADGSELVEKAMQLDENIILQGCEVLRDYHWRNDRKEEAYAWQQRLVERAELQEAAARERHQVLLSSDRFEPHGLSDDAIAKLRAQLQAIAGLRKAYLVKKRVQYCPHLPMYLLGFTITGPFRFYDNRRAQQVQREIQESVNFPGEALILCIQGSNSRFAGKFKRTYASEVV